MTFVLGGAKLPPKLELSEVPKEICYLVSLYADIFPPELPPGLPPHRAVDFHIDLVTGAQPPKHRMYRMAPAEDIILKETLEKYLADSKLEPAQSPFGAGVTFAPKKDGGLRLCIDYRALNALTVKDTYPIPRPEELLDSMVGSSIFSKLDLASGYHQIRIYAPHVPRTAFNTKYGSYQWKVLPFGLSNAPSGFMRLMNSLFAHLTFCAIYIDDIMVFSSSLEQHVQHLRQVFEILRANTLFCKPSKCFFARRDLEFCGFIVSKEGVSTVPSKVIAIRNWPVPTSVHEVRQFLGLVGFYQRFVPHYAEIILPLTKLLSKDIEFQWTQEQQDAFEKTKCAMEKATTLAFPEYGKPFILHVDASGSTVGATLSQESRSGVLRLLSCTSKKLNVHELNYPTHEHELLGAVHALKKWRHYLLGSKIILYTDNSALKFFLTTKNPSPRLTRWLDLFAQYDVELRHLPGAQNTAADALSRLTPLIAEPSPARPRRTTADYDSEGFVERTQHRVAERTERPPITSQVTSTSQQPTSQPPSYIPYVPPENLEHVDPRHTSSSTSASQVINNTSHILSDLETWRQAYLDDQDLRKRVFLEHSEELRPGYFKNHGFLWDGERILVPQRLIPHVLRRYHAHPTSGHLGVSKTFQLISRKYAFERMRPLIKEYIASCQVCQVTKPERTKMKGLLKPLSVPSSKWQSISVDWLDGLPVTPNGFDSVFVVIDRATLMVHLIPTSKATSARDVAQIFMDNIIRLHGVPRVIHSDRDPRLINSFWSELCKLLDIDHRPTTSYHPSANGLVERMNQTVSQILRSMFVSESSRFVDWTTKLSLAEIAINNSAVHESKFTPYYLNYGFHPCFFLDSADSVPPRQLLENAKDFSVRLTEDYTAFCKLAEDAKNRMKVHTDENRRNEQYAIGSYVYLNEAWRAKASGTGLAKLEKYYSGPYKILKIVAPDTYLLDMPESARHPVIHVHYLKLAHTPENLCMLNLKNVDLEDVMLDPKIFRKVCEALNVVPQIDLFASAQHHQLRTYCSRTPDSNAFACDAFALNWRNFISYVNPPWTLISAVLAKLHAEHAEALVIVPLWRSAPWFRQYCRYCVSHVILSGSVYLDARGNLRPPPYWLTCVGHLKG